MHWNLRSNLEAILSNLETGNHSEASLEHNNLRGNCKPNEPTRSASYLWGTSPQIEKKGFELAFWHFSQRRVNGSRFLLVWFNLRLERITPYNLKLMIVLIAYDYKEGSCNQLRRAMLLPFFHSLAPSFIPFMAALTLSVLGVDANIRATTATATKPSTPSNQECPGQDTSVVHGSPHEVCKHIRYISHT